MILDPMTPLRDAYMGPALLRETGLQAYDLGMR